MQRTFAFIINLVQDVNICKPIVEFARAGFECDILLLQTSAFKKRDASGLWTQEMSSLAQKTGAEIVEVRTPSDAVLQLQGRRGMLFALSESDLPNHELVHDIFRCCPAGWLKTTVQHGLECVGFAHNRAHDRAHGDRVGFGSDIVVGWSEADYTYSMRSDQRSKLFVAGPPMLLNPRRQGRRKGAEPARSLRGLICENLHSVRIGSGLREPFMDTFRDFAAQVMSAGGELELRAHPGGRFTEKNNVELPAGVTKNTAPLYGQDLGRFSFGISAPSTIILDLVLSEVPVGVWQDEHGSMDLSNYEGLRVVRSAPDWWRFAYEALVANDEILRDQRAYLDGLGFPSDVAGRYGVLLGSVA